jgi:hypothetical protein
MSVALKQDLNRAQNCWIIINGENASHGGFQGLPTLTYYLIESGTSAVRWYD